MSAWPDQGVHHGVPFATYRGDDISQSDTARTIIGKAVSKSLLVSFAKDPGVWKASPRKAQTKAMIGGSLFDCLLTTPEEFASRYAVSVYSEFRTNEAKAWRDEQESNGIEIVKPDQIRAAESQIAALMAHGDAARLVNGAQMQVAYRHATKYGFASKGLIDFIPLESGVLGDIKTCDPRALESRRSLQRHIMDWCYHVQAGAYCEGYTVASGVETSRFKFIFVTSAAPYRVAVVELPFSAITLGADTYKASMKRFSECMESDKWPSIWDQEMSLDLPDYAYLTDDQP